MEISINATQQALAPDAAARPQDRCVFSNQNQPYSCTVLLLAARVKRQPLGGLTQYHSYIRSPISNRGSVLTKSLPSIDDLMIAFQRLEGAKLGRGPDHPIQPNSTLTAAVARFLHTFPFLSRYPDYVRFLQHYAGATVEHMLPEQNKHSTVFLLGFAPEAWYIYEEMTDADLIDTNGFYIFAITLVNNSNHHIEHAYSFAATDQHPSGVYRSVRQPQADWDAPPVYEPYCTYFWEFVAEIVQKGGSPS